MSGKALTDFPERAERAVAEADRLAAELSRAGSSSGDVTELPQYQELVRLKVIVEIETSRTLSETARISSELEKTGLAEKLASAEEER
jgi:predicted ester cyclase